MRFAISLPQMISNNTFDPGWLRDYLSTAESLGFVSAWTQEAVLSSAPLLSPIELMTFAALIQLHLLFDEVRQMDLLATHVLPFV